MIFFPLFSFPFAEPHFTKRGPVLLADVGNSLSLPPYRSPTNSEGDSPAKDVFFFFLFFFIAIWGFSSIGLKSPLPFFGFLPRREGPLPSPPGFTHRRELLPDVENPFPLPLPQVLTEGGSFFLTVGSDVFLYLSLGGKRRFLFL